MRQNTYKAYIFAYTHPIHLCLLTRIQTAKSVALSVKASSVSLLLSPQGNYNPLKTNCMSILLVAHCGLFACWLSWKLKRASGSWLTESQFRTHPAAWLGTESMMLPVFHKWSRNLWLKNKHSWCNARCRLLRLFTKLRARSYQILFYCLFRCWEDFLLNK